MPGTRLIVGLGNPGAKYERTRHNVGFRVVDEVARRFGVTTFKKKDEALQAHVAARGIVLVKPLSFMNDSGRPVAKIGGWWKVSASDILIVSDDLDLPFGRLRMRASGGSGGHNGLKSIIEVAGEGFPRLRIGIGRGQSDTIDYVLSTFTPGEELALGAIVAAAADGVERFLERGLVDAVNYVNGWRSPDPSAREDESSVS